MSCTGVLALVSLTGCSRAGAPAATPMPNPTDGGFSNPIGLVSEPDASPMQAAAPPARCDTTFDAIERLVFDGVGCSGFGCHSLPGPDTPAAGMDLTTGHAYADIVNVASQTALAQPLLRIEPGDEQRSFLYLKVAAAQPSGVPLSEGAGAPMPLGLPPLTTEQLALLRTWIRAGAPADGVVDGTQADVEACRASL